MRNSILIIILEKKWPKQWKKLVLLKDWARCLLDILFSECISHLYGLILTKAIYFMINQTTKIYVRKLRLFNTMMLWLLPTITGHFLRLKKLVYQNIYSIWYHKATIGTTLGQVRMLRHFNAEQMYSDILVSHIPF